MIFDKKRRYLGHINGTVALGALFIASMAANSSAHAQSTTPDEAAADERGGLEEITVTARKMEERLETVPLALSAFSAQTLEAQNIRSLADLSSIAPGFNFRQQSGGTSGRNDRSNFNINFRGLYLGNSTPTSQGGLVFVDGAPVINGQIPAINDVARVEVLKGPQAAYFGRSTFTGAVSFTTTDPGNDWGGRIQAGIGDYGSYNVAGSINVPVIQDVLAFRFGASHEKVGGQYKNFAEPTETFGDRESNSYSMQMLFTPTSSLRVKASFSYGLNIDGPAAQGAIRGDERNCDLGGTWGPWYCGALPSNLPANLISANHTINQFSYDAMFGNIRDFYTEFDPTFYEKAGLKRRTIQGSLRMDWTVSDFTVSSITAFHTDKTQATFDLLFRDYRNTPNPLAAQSGLANLWWFQTNLMRTEDFSQEVRLASPQDWRVRFLLGANYFKARSIGGDTYGVNPTSGIGFGSTVRVAKPTTPAVFGALYFDITPELTLSAEGRYQWDKIEQNTLSRSNGTPFVGVPLKKTFKSFSPRLSLDYQFARDSILYALFSRGTRPGGFNESVAAQPLAVQEQIFANGGAVAFEEERLENYELGVKTRFWNNKASIRASVYYDKYSNGQITSQIFFFPPGQSTLTGINVTQNLGKVDLKGIELEADVAPLPGLQISGTFAINDSKIKQFVCLECRQYTADTDVIGNRLYGVPKTTWTVSTSYEQPVSPSVDVFGRVDYRHQGRQYVEYTNLAYSRRDDRVDVRIGAKTAGWTFEGFVTNLFNEQTLTGFFGTDPLGFVTPPSKSLIRVALPEKRRVGARASFEF